MSEDPVAAAGSLTPVAKQMGCSLPISKQTLTNSFAQPPPFCETNR